MWKDGWGVGEDTKRMRKNGWARARVKMRGDGERERKCERMGVAFAIVKVRIHEVHVRG